MSIEPVGMGKWVAWVCKIVRSFTLNLDLGEAFAKREVKLKFEERTVRSCPMTHLSPSVLRENEAPIRHAGERKSL